MTLSLLAQESFGEGLFAHYGDRLGSFEGVGVAVLGLLVAALVLALDRFKWAVLAGAIAVATFSIKRLGALPELPPPFFQIGEWSQAISFGALGLMAIAAFRPTEWRRTKLLHPAVFALLALQLTICLRQLAGGLPQKGLGGIVIYTVMFLVLGIGIGRWLYDERQVGSLVRAVSWAAGLLIVCSVLVMTINYSSAFAGNRFMGNTANPQRLGAMLGMALPFSLALVVDRKSPPHTRTAHAAIAAFAVLMVIASGSRSGLLLVLVGTAVFFRTRLGPAVLAAVGVGVFALAGYLLLLGEAVSEASTVIVRTENSRSEVWANLWELFKSSPAVGVAMEYAPGESSYLSALVMAGVVGFVPLAVLVWLLGTAAYKVVRRRRALGPLAVYGDVAVASVAQMLMVWAFEAFALGTVTDHMLVVYCTLAMLGLFRERLADPAPATAASAGFAAGASGAEPPDEADAYAGDADHHLPTAV